jgi:hypothetical protein
LVRVLLLCPDNLLSIYLRKFKSDKDAQVAFSGIYKAADGGRTQFARCGATAKAGRSKAADGRRGGKAVSFSEFYFGAEVVQAEARRPGGQNFILELGTQ